MAHGQREAVYVTTMNVLGEHNINFDDGNQIEDVVTKEIRAQIISALVAGFLNGEVEMSAEGQAKYFGSEPKLRSYTSGLVSNWFRKDTRLNGGGKYTPKNPGSRLGSTDEQIKALKALRATKEGDADAVKVIDEAIATRKAEIEATKTKVVLTDAMMALIPADLKAKLGL